MDYIGEWIQSKYRISVGGIATPVKRASVPFRQEGAGVTLTPPDFGERTGVECGCRRESDGSLTDWHHPGDRIEWECSFPEGGVFRARLTTRSRYHSSPWQGAREVELCWHGVPVLRTRLAADRALPGDYYPAAESDLGEFRAVAGESGILSLRTVAAEPPAAGMSLVSLELKALTSSAAK